MEVEGIESSVFDSNWDKWENESTTSKDRAALPCFSKLKREAAAAQVDARMFFDRQICYLEPDSIVEEMSKRSRSSSRTMYLETHYITCADRPCQIYVLNNKNSKNKDKSQEKPPQEDPVNAEINRLYYVLCTPFACWAEREAAKERLKELAATHPKAAKKLENIKKASEEHTTVFEDIAHAAKKVGHGIEKAAHEVKEFVVDHKKEVIAVAAVVVAVATVAGIAIVAGAAAAEAAGAAAVATAAAATRRKDERDDESSSPIPLGTGGQTSLSVSLDSSSENTTSYSSLGGPDLSHFDSPFSGMPQQLPPSDLSGSLGSSSGNRLQPSPDFAISQPAFTSWNHNLPPKEDQHPTPVYPVSNEPLTSRPVLSDSKGNSSSPVAFIDPDGPPRVYDNPRPEPSRSKTTESTGSQPVAFIDPDGSLRVYDIPPPEPYNFRPIGSTGSQPVAFIDPDGSLRVYNIPPPEPYNFRTFEIPGSQLIAFIDPDGSPRVYDNPLPGPYIFRTFESPGSLPVAFIDPDGSVRVYNNPPPEPSRSKTFEIPGYQLARGEIGGINGIGNEIGHADAHARYIKELSGGHHIQWVHNSSNSIPLDVAETIIFNYQGVSATTKLLKENWVQFHEQHKDDPGAKYLQFCHSQGAVHVKNALLDAPQEIRDRIIVVAIAPAAVVADDICFRSFNYASKRDPIPYAEVALYAGSEDPLVRELAEQKLEAIKKQLILLDPHPDASGLDHEFESPTFKDSIERHLAGYVNQYGVAK